MSATMKKLVKLTSEQYTELFKTGQTTDKDGNVRVKDPTGETQYTPDILQEVVKLNNKIDELIIQPRQLPADRVIQMDLEEEYAYIIAENPELETRGCVGFRTTLRPGETVLFNPSSTTYERCFLNGVERSTNYTYEGDYNETVVAFYFSSEIANVQLNEVTYLLIEELFVKKGIKDVVVHSSYYNALHRFYNIGTSIVPTYCKLFINKSEGTTVPKEMYELYSEATKIEISTNYIVATNNTYLRKISLPKVASMAQNKYTGTTLIAAPNNYCTIETPVLEKTNNMGAPGGYERTIMSGFSHYKFPNTIREIGFDTLKNIGVIDLTDANEAQFNTRWYLGNPCENVIIPDGWKNSINLATAGANFDKDWYLLLLEKLAIVEEIQSLTIPTSIYESLTQDEKEIALFKGWQLGGA